MYELSLIISDNLDKLSYLFLNNLLTKLGSENISYYMYSSALFKLSDFLPKLSYIINDNSYINNIISNNSTSQSVDSFIFQNIESNIHHFHDVNITDETSSLCNNDNIIDTNIDTNTNIIHTNTIEINKDTNIIDTNIDKVSMNGVSIDKVSMNGVTIDNINDEDTDNKNEKYIQDSINDNNIDNIDFIYIGVYYISIFINLYCI